MTVQKAYRLLLWLQAIYYFITAIWGLVDIDSFMTVTARKLISGW